MKYRCDNCKSLLYETQQTGTGFESVIHSPDYRPPIVVDIGRVTRVMFCSRTCAARWFLASDESSLRSGYPIF